MNHFEARDYDPVIGRWMVMDPARHFASGYVGMGNNPILGVDPDGRFSSQIFSKDGKKFLGTDSEGYKGDVILMDEADFWQGMDHSISESLAANEINGASFLAKADISYDAMSFIYTHVVAQLGSEVDMNLIKDGGISINSKYYANPGYNVPGSTFRYSYIPETKTLTVHEKFQNELSNVETIQNMLGVHELIGHGMEGFTQEDGNHYKAYELQKAHRTFHGLSDRLQKQITDRISNPKYH